MEDGTSPNDYKFTCEVYTEDPPKVIRSPTKSGG